MAMYLPRGSLVTLADAATPSTKIRLSEHNRQPVQFNPQRIDTKQRMANGRMRSWFVADKGGWSTSWSQLPDATNKTVDGNAGAEAIENFYYEHPGEFLLYIREPDGTESQYTVMFSSFSKTVSKRGVYELWDIDMSLEEV